MPLHFAINGLGRIGRALLRIARERDSIELVAVNDLGSARELAGLIDRDTLHGRFAGRVSAVGDHLVVDGREIATFQTEDPAAVPWHETPARVVVDATGRAKTGELAAAHLRSGGEGGPTGGRGIERVVVSANAEGVDLTLCIGVNDDEFDPERHHLLSAASCTTNCLTPVAHVLHENFGWKRGLLNTVHSYNNDQHLLEYRHSDPRRARSATLNMIPTTTSAIRAFGRVLPELADRIQGLAVRVPTPNVSLIDLVVEFDRQPSVEDVQKVFREAAEGPLRGVLAVTDEELVSSDFLGDPHSAIVDLPLTQEVGGLYRVVAWYDNEWGHASRLADTLELIARRS